MCEKFSCHWQPVMSKSAVSPPLVGQRFVDDEGVHWTVRNLVLSDSLEGFFLASLSHGRTTACDEGTIVLAPLEFEALCRSRGLKVTYLPSRPVVVALEPQPVPAGGAHSPGEPRPGVMQ